MFKEIAKFMVLIIVSVVIGQVSGKFIYDRYLKPAPDPELVELLYKQADLQERLIELQKKEIETFYNY